MKPKRGHSILLWRKHLNSHDIYLIETPWDSIAFGIKTYEILELSTAAFDLSLKNKGHYTVKVDPVCYKKILHDYGFYYCDTLIEPYCSEGKFINFEHNEILVSQEIKLNDVVDVCHGVFAHGRFHRDFNIDRDLADLRYDNWITQIYDAGGVFGLLYKGELAAFIGLTDNKLVLHAVSEKFQGKGLAKYLWSAACREFFRVHEELISSVSAANVAVINLYASLGFRFRNPVDVYHKVVL